MHIRAGDAKDLLIKWLDEGFSAETFKIKNEFEQYCLIQFLILFKVRK